MKVPNVQPTRTNPKGRRLAIIGEAPGSDETSEGKPFVGQSGRLLDTLLSNSGIDRSECFIGNVCQIQPPGNIIGRFDWHGPQIQEGLSELRADLANFEPTMCLLLGNTSLRAAKAEGHKISDWRGSLFRSSIIGSPMQDYKCLATYHPASILREYSNLPPSRFDFKRAAKESFTKDLILPERNLITTPSYDYITSELRRILLDRLTIANDIEGYVGDLTCCSFATSPYDAFIIPFRGGCGTSIWTVEEETNIWRSISEVLECPDVPKIFQNFLYDSFVYAYSYGITTRGLKHDTMLGHWELYAEMPKALDFQTSIYTLEPYYKDDRKATGVKHWEYCCKDSCVTFECALEQEKYLPTHSTTSVRHYKENVELLNALLYMEKKGILYDHTTAKQLHSEVSIKVYELQTILDAKAEKGLGYMEHPDLLTAACAIFCFKRARSAIEKPEDMLQFAKKHQENNIKRFCELAAQPPSLSTVGELSALLKVHLNIDSVGPSGQFTEFLYKTMNFPPQYVKESGRLTDKLSTNVSALLTIYRKTEHPIIKTCLNLRNYMTQLETLGKSPDLDGRIRCGYNIVGTDTGRLSCYESPTGSGFNLQTVTKKFRHLFRADPGYWMFQCDLAGADGWTVAAYCAKFGDMTMLNDYNAGMKPAKLVALMYLGHDVARMEHDKLVTLCKEVKDGESTSICSLPWLYFGCKRVQHGTNYGMGENTMSAQILQDSYKLTGEAIFVEPKVCARIRNLYLNRYPGIPRWHEWIKRELLNTASMTSASGRKRIFFGRKKSFDQYRQCEKFDETTFKAACSNEPQDNTTYVCNRALSKLWNDPENKQGFSMRIEPLHQVHDALIGQFRKEDTSWAIGKIKSYFDNPITIAGRQITIPFEGHYGESWGSLKEGIIV